MIAQAASDSRPFNARFVEAMCRRRGWNFSDLDGGAGYLFAVTAGDRRVLCGSGAICAYPGNAASAYTIARDKAFTHAALSAAGLDSVPTELVFLEAARRHLRAPGREASDWLARATTLDFPLFAKPNRGAHGDFAERIEDADALADYFTRAARRHDQVVIQPLIDAPEYRVFVSGGRACFQYRKSDGGLVGDGVASWRALFEAMNAELAAEALSPVPAAVFTGALVKAGIRADERAGIGQRLALPGRRNLASGAQTEAFSQSIEPELARLALAAAAAIGLDVAGIDLFCAEGGAAHILEVNANPSFASLETLGELDLAQEIWDDILARALGEGEREEWR
ncbi:ATP-grasp domain-containing protein [Maricaulis maris]|uniref:ATP-grasp domain-containing protein n=1 Tax=Maricaulis maris TaxID=74318 RepID=UPI003B8CF576